MNTERKYSPTPPFRCIFHFATTLPEQRNSEPRSLHSLYARSKLIRSVQFGTRQRVKRSPLQKPMRSFVSLPIKLREPIVRREPAIVRRVVTARSPSLYGSDSPRRSLFSFVTKKKTLLTSVTAGCEQPKQWLSQTGKLAESNSALSKRDTTQSVETVSSSPTLSARIPQSAIPTVPVLKATKSSENIPRKIKLKVPLAPSTPKPLPAGGSKARISTKKVNLKEAIRDREWVLKAQEQLTGDWCKTLRSSNGVTVAAPTEGYSYYLGRGNNHPLVAACFKSRAWVRLWEEEEMDDANVVWTQAKVRRLFKWYPESNPDDILQSQRSKPTAAISCTVRLTPRDATKKQQLVDVSSLGYELITQSQSFLQLSATLELDPRILCTHNKLEHNYHLTNKKTLFHNLKTYCEVIDQELFSIVPVTFHITEGLYDPNYRQFLSQYSSSAENNTRRLHGIWILKPGENTNRGTGITVCKSLDQISAILGTESFCPSTGAKRSYILQKYIENPLLISKRKFDIRCYALITAINGVMQCYFYHEGYLRTSCKEFSLKDVTNRYIHLTNDAVQKSAEDYGRFETGNKLSYSDFQRYLDTHSTGKSIQNDILPQLRSVVRTTVLATFAKLNADQRQFSFELLGYDFMVDANYKVWLLEVNTNPCLELSSPLLARIIPAVVENAFRIVIDPYFPDPPSARKSVNGEVLVENKFELVFSSLVEGEELKQRLGPRFSRLVECDPALGEPWEDGSFYSSCSDQDC